MYYICKILPFFLIFLIQSGGRGATQFTPPYLRQWWPVKGCAGKAHAVPPSKFLPPSRKISALTLNAETLKIHKKYSKIPHFQGRSYIKILGGPNFLVSIGKKRMRAAGAKICRFINENMPEKP